jgi:hypothetical protein
MYTVEELKSKQLVEVEESLFVLKQRLNDLEKDYINSLMIDDHKTAREIMMEEFMVYTIIEKLQNQLELL